MAFLKYVSASLVLGGGLGYFLFVITTPDELDLKQVIIIAEPLIDMFHFFCMRICSNDIFLFVNCNTFLNKETKVNT